jgi:putative transposase
VSTFKGAVQVAVLEKAKTTKEFDYWIKLSTLKKGEPIYIPIKLYKRALKLLDNLELKKIVRLKKKGEKWYCSLVVLQDKEQKENEQRVGVDVGAKSLLTDSNGNYYGTENYGKLLKEVEKLLIYQKNRQKEEACLKRKNSDVELKNKRYLERQRRLTDYRKNEIGKAINEFVSKNKDKQIILEDLSLNGGTSSSCVNRILNRSLIGYLKNRLRFKVIDSNLNFIGVNPAYTSQECSRCGWVERANRLNREWFICQFCLFKEKADLNASRNILRRSQNKEVNQISYYKEVKTVLLKRFYDTHSVSSWLDLDSFLKMNGKELRKLLNRQSATLKPTMQ